MKDLFRESFKITNENGEKAIYSWMRVKLLPTLMLIKANETLSKEFILTNSYDFPGANEIRITYSDKISCCPEPQEINCDQKQSKCQYC